MTKLTIRGAYGETNFGDDLLMCVFENFFLSDFKDIQINFVGTQNNYTCKLLKNSSYNQNSFPADWEIYGGGTQFFAFQSSYKKTWLQKIKILIHNPRILKLKIAECFSKNDKNLFKTAFLGFGIGPFYENQEAINNAKINIAKANFVGVRDQVSLNYCNEWNIEAHLGADVVFSSFFEMPNFLKTNFKTNLKKIGIIVRDWDWEKSGSDYIDNLFKFYDSYKEAELQFIVFAPSKDKVWINKLKGEKVLIWDPREFSIQSFLSELNYFDAFISARYHGAIIASLLKKPVICVEIEPKLKILTQQVKEFTLWEKPFEIDNLVALVKELDYEVDFEKTLMERKFCADTMLQNFKNYYQKIK